MYLTREEERMLAGEYGEAVAIALKAIVKVGESIGAKRLVRVSHVHVSGVSYKNIGEPGARFLEKLASLGARAVVYTTSNPTCVDLAGGTTVFSMEYLSGQLRVNRALERIGVSGVYGCTPYFMRRPAAMEHLCWGESNAVAVANSIYGAMTNREGGPLSVLAAITGRTSYAGLHLLEERVARVDIVYNGATGLYGSWASLLGLYIGEAVDEIPIVRNAVFRDFTSIRLFLAASAASGSHGLVVIDGVTPRHTYTVDIGDRMVVDDGELRRYRDSVSAPLEYRDGMLAYIGCPHLSLTDLYALYRILSRYKRVRYGARLLVTIPYAYRGVAGDVVKLLRAKGVEVAFGTCPVVSVFREKPSLVATDSGKALFYLKRIHGVDVALASVEQIARVVMAG